MNYGILRNALAGVLLLAWSWWAVRVLADAPGVEGVALQLGPILVMCEGLAALRAALDGVSQRRRDYWARVTGPSPRLRPQHGGTL